MKKKIILATLGLLAIVALLAGTKTLQIGAMIDQGKKYVPPPETVTAAEVRSETWDASLTAIGTLTAVQGVTVAAELPGKVTRIAFVPGSHVKKGDLLLCQDTSSEEAQLPGANAQANMARAELERAKKMAPEKIISQADYDRTVATYEQALSQVNNIKAAIAKKMIRAPFSGRLGIRQANLGQILREGDPIVTLQSLDPIFVDFTVPQQQLANIGPALPVKVTCDALPNLTVEGKITAINPMVEAETRNVKLQATVNNGSEKLRPGMFVNVSVGLPVRRDLLTIPATAVLYAPYGDSVFVIAEDPGQKGKKAVRQQFVRLGEKRGDFVSVTSGLQRGVNVVSTGVFKLRNGQSVVVDNKLAPEFRHTPKPENN